MSGDWRVISTRYNKDTSVRTEVVVMVSTRYNKDTSVRTEVVVMDTT